MKKDIFLERIFSYHIPIKFPHRLQWRKIYILPTPQGILFIIVLIGMLVGSLNYNNNLGFLLTFLLGSMAFISMFYSIKNLAGIEILSSIATPVFAGEIAKYEFMVRVEKDKRPAVSFNFGKGAKTVKDFLNDSNNCVKVSAMTEKRGIFYPKPLVISTQYPFGLFRSWAILKIKKGCTVYPKPLSGKVDPTVDITSGDNNNEKEIWGVDDFKELRPYQPGDPIHRISWKAFSRSLNLFTKTFIGKTGSGILLDWDSVNEYNIEKKLSIFCHGVLKLHRMNIVYGLNLPEESIREGSGDSHKHRCLKALALVSSPQIDHEGR